MMKINNCRLAIAFLIFSVSHTVGQDEDSKLPVELTVIEESIGVWDAEIKVWAQGKDSPPITFKGVETNRAYGKYWLSSDFDSEYAGTVVRVHSIIGYDADKKQLVGTVIDQGKYSASMTGRYDPKAKTVHWTTKAKTPNGQLMTQETSVIHKSPTERFLILSMPIDGKDDYSKFMEIKFKKRKKVSPTPSPKGPSESEK